MTEIVLNSNYLSIPQKQEATTSSLLKSSQKIGIYFR